MVTNQTECCTREQRYVIKLLVVEKCEICRRMCVVYGEACFSHKLAKLFKEDRNSIQDEDRPDRPTIASTPEMVVSFNMLIMVGKKNIQ